MRFMSLIEATRKYVETHITPDFHEKRLHSLQKLKLQSVLMRKNPYLFRSKAIISAPDLIKQLLLAHLSSHEETIFGAFLESLAIHVCAQVYNGRKSTTEGIDLEFSRDGARYIVSIKSGPNWGNSSQIARMAQNFDRARRIAGPSENIIAINGCCYGRDENPRKDKNYFKLCGQNFWYLISNEKKLYREIIEPLGYQAQRRNDEFEREFGCLHTRFTTEFAGQFCHSDGSINWDELLMINSGADKLWRF